VVLRHYHHQIGYVPFRRHYALGIVLGLVGGVALAVHQVRGGLAAGMITNGV
jgi:hypothetical protein